MAYLYILGTILFTVYGQLIIKFRISGHGEFPSALRDQGLFILKLLADPLILSGFVAALIAALFWMAALTKFNLSYAYPFMGLNFVLIFLLSMFILNEPFSYYKVIGVGLIILGIYISSRSI